MKSTVRGFSFIEITIVLMIIGIIMTIAIPGYRAVQNRAQVRSAQSTLKGFKSAIESYKVETGEYPTKFPDDLQRRPSAQMRGWAGPYVEDNVKMTDPWGNEYQYKFNGKGAKPPYSLFSFGAKGEEADEGEYVVAE
jgi:general secretion pathway protein G